MTIDEAEKSIRQAAIAGFIIAGLTALVVTAALFLLPGGEFADPWNYIDVVILAGLSVGVLFRSRTAAVLLFLYYVVGKILMMISMGRLGGVWITVVIAYFLIKGVLGTFSYHRRRKEDDPDYSAASLWAYLLWPIAALAIVGLLGFALLSETGVTTPLGVVSAAELGPKAINELRDMGILEPNEQVVLFYTTDLVSVLGEGNVLTDRRVISYETEDEERFVMSAPYDQIRRITVEDQENAFADARILVETTTGEDFVLVASKEKGGDKKFLDELERRRKPVGK